MSQLPLSHLFVLDLTAHRAGPTAVRQLADWGATVIKIEQPSDGKMDSMGGARHGFDFQNLHRNKKAMTLNLKSKEGHAIFMKLAEKADVIVENYRSDVKHRLKIDYDEVAKVNPRIIYGSIAGFGQSGPDAARPGVDQIAQGMGGLMSITGEPGAGPMRVGIPIADLTSGLLLAQAIILALYDRERTGKGQWVHTSLIEAQIFMLDFQAARWLMKGEVAKQAGNDHPTSIPTGVFKTSDGHINIAVAGQKMWEKFIALFDDPAFNSADYADAKSRSKNRKALNALIESHTSKKTSAEWIETFNKAGAPAGEINDIKQVFDLEQVRHLGLAPPAPFDGIDGGIRLVRHRLVVEVYSSFRRSSKSAATSPSMSLRTPSHAATSSSSRAGCGTAVGTSARA